MKRWIVTFSTEAQTKPIPFVVKVRRASGSALTGPPTCIPGLPYHKFRDKITHSILPLNCCCCPSKCQSFTMEKRKEEKWNKPVAHRAMKVCVCRRTVSACWRLIGRRDSRRSTKSCGVMAHTSYLRTCRTNNSHSCRQSTCNDKPQCTKNSVPIMPTRLFVCLENEAVKIGRGPKHWSQAVAKHDQASDCTMS